MIKMIQNDLECQEHIDWLFEMHSQGTIDSEMHARALLLWFILRDKSKQRIKIPASAAGPDGGIFYSWNKGIHHLEAELNTGNQAVELYYRNRETNQSVLYDYILGSKIPEDFQEYFEIFYKE